ncbi:MAG TPA: SDR family oxidoreductase [Pantanalinema sp.]
MIKRVVIVTGASRGIGAEIARRLAFEGYRVVLAARSHAPLHALAAELPEAIAHPLDVTDPVQVQGLVDRTMEQWGRIDALINNAGHAHVAPVEEITPDQFAHQLNVNVMGPFLCTRAVLPIMRAQHGGQVVNVLSVAAKRAFPNWSAYCASKFALDGFGQALAEELKGTGIRLTAIYPGATDTPLWDGMGMSAEQRAGMVRPEDVADAVAFALRQPARTRVAEVIVEPSRGDV